MSQFDEETRVTLIEEGIYRCWVHDHWNIGANPNGGYLASLALQALQAVAGQPDPITATTHFLRPGAPDTEATIRTEVVRKGRAVTTLRAELIQQSQTRLVVLAAFGDCTSTQGIGATLDPAPPDLPPIEHCVHRSELQQGVEVPLLSRVDVLLRPENATPDPEGSARIEGWVQLADGTAPTTLSLPLSVDAFPPSPIARFRQIGWVPTLELTVHARRRPQPGWLRGRFECDDLVGGRMIESGTLWDSTGAVVARSRQLGLILQS